MSYGGGEVELAGAGSRLLAYVFDLFWLFPLFLLLMLVADFVNGGQMSVGGELMANVIAALVVIIFWAQQGATPGKRVLGLRIVDADTGGLPPVNRLVLRYVGYIVSAIPLGLGYLWVLWDPKRQAWHDKMAGTLVVQHRHGTA
jgi:uncharacterized RDD family membrane protein YckC